MEHGGERAMSYDPMSVVEKRRLAWLFLAWQDALLVGGQAPVVRAAYERFRDPQPGDWVIEATTLVGIVKYPDRYDPELLSQRWDGQFVRFLRSEIRTHVDDEGGEWSEDVQICENPDGTEFAWTNATLRSVPLDGIWAPSTERET
jgi:hypothetical protein